MESTQEKLRKILYPIDDIELDIFELYLDNLLSNGETFVLNNINESCLYNLLLLKEKPWETEYLYFHVMGNTTKNYRPYMTKAIFFEHDSHEYELTVKSENYFKVYRKSSDIYWKDWLLEIKVPINSSINIKETKKGKYWEKIKKASYFDRHSYYEKIWFDFRCEKEYTYLCWTNRWFKSMGIKSKINNKNKQFILNNLNLLNISNDICFLNYAIKNNIDIKGDMKTLEELKNEYNEMDIQLKKRFKKLLDSINFL